MTTLKLLMAITIDMLRSFKNLFRIHTVTLVEKRSEVENIVTFIFETDHPLRYDAGQYGIWLLKRWVWGKPARLFSIASPAGDRLQLSTRISKTDFKQKLHQLQPGDTMRFIGPVGRFTLPRPLPKSIVLVAGGIGITPMRAIAKYAHDMALPLTVTLVHSSDGQYLYKDEMSLLATDMYFATRDTFDSTLLSVIRKQGNQAVYYLSGPPKLVELADEFLKQHGCEHIKKDGFLGY